MFLSAIFLLFFMALVGFVIVKKTHAWLEDKKADRPEHSGLLTGLVWSFIGGLAIYSVLGIGALLGGINLFGQPLDPSIEVRNETSTSVYLFDPTRQEFLDQESLPQDPRLVQENYREIGGPNGPYAFLTLEPVDGQWCVPNTDPLPAITPSAPSNTVLFEFEPESCFRADPGDHIVVTWDGDEVEIPSQLPPFALLVLPLLLVPPIVGFVHDRRRNRELQAIPPPTGERMPWTS